jgi:CheY-like chemotaxis protein
MDNLASQERQTRTVLVVDDDPGVRGLIEESLTEAGFDVIVAPETVTALRRLEEHPETNLCLVDVMMPSEVPDGATFAQTVRRVRPDIPLILMTGYSGGLLKLLDAETRVLSKPFRISTLLREIERHLPSHKRAVPT